MADYLDNTATNGLMNIGNTCYMNCILQCLSHCRGLRDFFLLGQFKQHINRDNPIGTGGKTAEVYHALLQEMWSVKRSSTNPHALKSMLASKSDMYSGFQQQDAQEFLSILLDTLHEDINQGDIKKTFVMPDGDGKCDEEVANQSWEFHKQRNSSYFVENFMGQYKSTVSCLECGKVSITFDPYMYLSLPLAKDKSPIEYYFLALATPSIARCKVYTQLPIKTSNLLRLISEEIKVSQEKLAMFTVLKSTIVTVFKSDAMITSSDMGQGQLIIQENRSSVDGSITLKVHFALSEPFMQKNCAKCNTTGELKRCTRCMKVSYCNRECQRKHYDAHKRECKGTPQTVGIPLVLFTKQRDLKSDKLLNFIATSNIYSTFIKDRKIKLKFDLKVGNSSGEIDEKVVIGSESKPKDIVRLALQDSTFVLMYDNSSKNLIGEQEFDIFDHGSLRSRQPKCSLGDCLDSFTQEERLPDTELWKCPRCNKLQKATKQISLYSCPNYLVVHLKRFQAKNIIMFDKVDKHITFPVNRLDLADYSVRRSNMRGGYYIYDLYGIANHYGSLYRGHYTAYAKLSGVDCMWREFDDRNVTDVTEGSIQTQSAYVLFYKKREFKESISRGILSSEDEEEYFDASSGGHHKESDHSDDNSCYFEAKVSDEFADNVNISQSSSPSDTTTDIQDTIEIIDTESQKTAEGSSSSDVSCEYVKVERTDGNETKSSDTSDSESPIYEDESPVQESESSEGTVRNVPIGLDSISVNFEDQLD